MNPYKDKATAARKRADALNKPTAYDEAMRSAFPLGGGYGNKAGRRRVDASIERAMRAVKAEREAKGWEAMADRFDRGEITAQGRPPAKVKAKEPKPVIPDNERLFACNLGGGITYCDRAIEKNGDYKRVAFLPNKRQGIGYDPLEWRAQRVPPFLRLKIEQDAARMIAQGEERAAADKEARQQEKKHREDVFGTLGDLFRP